MRAYLLDEIAPPEITNIRTFLAAQARRSGLDDLFWVELPEDLLSKEQFSHKHCQPHAFAVELGPDWVKLEFFVRTLRGMRCTCPGYCTEQQRNFIIRFADGMIQTLGIKT